MGRRPCCEKVGVNRGSWSAQEDKILEDYIKTHGEGKWRDLPKRAGLNRCGKSCRLRWLNYLRPDIKRGNISEDEEELIIKLHKLLGNRWSLIAGRLPGRTDNEIKNYWNTNLSKRPDQRQQKKNQDHNNFLDSGDIKPKKSRIRPDAAQIIKSSPESSPPVIRTKASKCTKVFVPLEAAADSTKLVNTYEDDDSAVPAADFENKMMNLVRGGTESPSSSTQQDGNNENFSDLLIDFDIGELLIPDLPAGPSCSSNDQKTSELVQQSAGNIVIQGDQSGLSLNKCACLDLAAHFGYEASNDRLDDLIAEAMPESWMAGGLLQQNEAEVDLSHFLNSE